MDAPHLGKLLKPLGGRGDSSPLTLIHENGLSVCRVVHTWLFRSVFRLSISYNKPSQNLETKHFVVSFHESVG